MNLFAHINTLLALIIVVIIGTARGLVGEFFFYNYKLSSV
ncbi:hypothetical protein H320_17470 [Vibrio parahaemolyticus 49]|nr:hypothetical protein H320_17470 [Vibrio parahaemolyticus 49]